MYKILEQIKNHPDAWPFLDPVDEDFAPDYYTKISQPMDLEKMEQRVSTKYYQSLNEFMSDFDLIVDNCKKYNGPESGNESNSYATVCLCCVLISNCLYRILVHGRQPFG